MIGLIDREIKKLSYGDEPQNLYEPIRYIFDLGGKRIRPLIALLSYQLFRDDIKKILEPSLAIEVFHNFTLLHDDIMDNAPLRRNKPTVHKKWNENIAILSGDVMLVRAYDHLLAIDESRIKSAITKFNNCAAEVCEGQQFDMNFEQLNTVTEEEYIQMIKLKTAVLLGFSAELGGLVAEADETELLHLREFGINMGIGFQLMDDLLDVYAENEKFGKQIGGDILANKKTYLLIKALEKAEDEDLKLLQYWLNTTKFDNSEKIAAITSIYDQLEIEKLTKKAMNTFFEAGIEQLNCINVEDEKKSNMRSLINYLMNREN